MQSSKRFYLLNSSSKFPPPFFSWIRARPSLAAALSSASEIRRQELGVLKTEESFEFSAVVDGALKPMASFPSYFPVLVFSFVFALSALPSLHCRFVFFILQVVLHVCDASSWFFLQCVSLNILISMLSAGFLLISALFD